MSRHPVGTREAQEALEMLREVESQLNSIDEFARHAFDPGDYARWRGYVMGHVQPALFREHDWVVGPVAVAEDMLVDTLVDCLNEEARALGRDWREEHPDARELSQEFEGLILEEFEGLILDNMDGTAVAAAGLTVTDLAAEALEGAAQPAVNGAVDMEDR